MWVCEEKVAATDTPPFKCLTPSGQVAAGKKYQVCMCVPVWNLYVHTYVYLCVCMCVPVCVPVCVYLCVSM